MGSTCQLKARQDSDGWVVRNGRTGIVMVRKNLREQEGWRDGAK